MKLNRFLPLFVATLGWANADLNAESLELDYEAAVALASLPMKCYNQEFPFMDLYVVNSADELQPQKVNHPIFYGCFDWHSSAHGHWMMAALAAKFPATDLSAKVSAIFDEQFTADKVDKELKFLKARSRYQRTYGWTWFLKLQTELLQLSAGADATLAALAGKWSRTLQPLADHLAGAFLKFIPKLAYPVRVGTHTNTAFGLVFAFEYAQHVENQDLVNMIRQRAFAFYGRDASCPLSWEPSGSDFLSPCLQEADLVVRICYNNTKYFGWTKTFLPQILTDTFVLAPGEVLDESDGHLVHLHGVNFSRAWNFYSVALKLAKVLDQMPDLLPNRDETIARLLELGDQHIRASLDSVVGSQYVGSHWLGSFITYALQKREEAQKLKKKAC